MVPLKEVQAATGYIRGGVTALACKKDYPVYIDELAEICDVISISAGMRGLQILLAPEDYIRAVKGKVVAITKGEASSHYMICRLLLARIAWPRFGRMAGRPEVETDVNGSRN